MFSGLKSSAKVRTFFEITKFFLNFFAVLLANKGKSSKFA